MPNRKIYTEDELQLALERIRNGMSIHQASKMYNIPRGTIQNRLHNRVKKNITGPPSILNLNEELAIVQWLISNHEKGFPRRKQDVQAAVKEFLDKSPRPNPFKNNMPGDKWYAAFLKRNPVLAVRTPEPVTDASSKVSENDIRKWFEQIQEYMNKKNYAEIVDHPERVFNGDETNFLMCPKTGKVLAPKGKFFLKL